MERNELLVFVFRELVGEILVVFVVFLLGHSADVGFDTVAKLVEPFF